MLRYPTVLTIAGSDSGGGAGIQADLKTIAALGAYGTSAITALTAQNTLGVRSIYPVSASFLQDQLEVIFDDFTVDAVKIGMINTVEVAETIGRMLDKYKPSFVVFDPVMVSTSGARLIQEETVEALWKELFPRVHLITPNLDEAEILVHRKITSKTAIKEAAEEMVEKGCQAVLLKGGHLVDSTLYDVLAQDGMDSLILETAYIASKNVHGTGCTLSSAIAAFVALGNALPEAVLLSKKYISGAIMAGKDVVTGHGSGPLNHTFAPQAMKIIKN